LGQKINLKSLLLLALFIFMITLGRDEYFIIVEKFVKLICTSCIGI
jgi:hypothetical protein